MKHVAKHAAVRSSSAARSVASRVLVTLALATAATAVASPATAHEGDGRGGHDGMTGHDRSAVGHDGGHEGGMPRYEPRGRGGAQAPSDGTRRDGGGQDRTGWNREAHDDGHEAARDVVRTTDAALAPERVREVVETVPVQVAVPAAEPVEMPSPGPTAAPTVTELSEPSVAVQAPGQQWRGPATADTPGAELMAYVPTGDASVRGIEEQASTLTDATLDAPVRLATTGAEAVLTSVAGALVVGGAGALFVARRSRVQI